MNGKTDQRVRLTLAQLEVFAAIARGGSVRSAAGEVARSQSAASSALAELETALGVQLFDRVGRKLMLNENGRALLPRAAGLVEQALEAESLFKEAHAAPLRLAASYTVGEYLLPDLIVQWKRLNPRGQVRLDISNTKDVFDAVASFAVDVGFIEGQRTHPDLLVRRWRTDELVVVASPAHPLAAERVTLARLAQASWILREPGSGTRDAADRWLIENLPQLDVGLELGSNEAVKRAVASGLGLGCLSHHAVLDAVANGWLVELKTPLPPMRRTLAVVVHRAKQLGSASRAFVQHCLQSVR
ncbi:LysR family transcriptional regulator [Ramlibacter sp. AN1133]|uniref:LysR family transcriptional regulator n=1 Tax=Ramlibacter sp. AN1133 TaxID=3133429 RepID=UPI0030C504A1